ncbi:uncharacterized protein KY384_000883 [Bacidia gigantensis]|uniref:uncharacterized protein n=1 Tax=Bacidia gigantensis TaxID=2732470 RepID=UPI001D0491E6|nr:uncharacterized protein KY384_000883 [Bacidia gigantensis]KAG8534040.1 hypothetical protein KY384_000883 [Bacidia gigantensis]
MELYSFPTPTGSRYDFKYLVRPKSTNNISGLPIEKPTSCNDNEESFFSSFSDVSWDGMDALTYKRLLNGLTFRPETQLKIFESCVNTDKSLNYEWQSEDDIRKKLSDLRDEATGGLTVVVGHGNGRSVPLGITTACFQEITTHLRIPRHFLSSLNSNNGSLSHFTEYRNMDGGYHKTHLHILIQTTKSPSRSFCCALRVNIRNGALAVLFFDRDEESVNEILGRLRVHQKVLHENPIAFLSLLFEMHCHASEHYRAYLDDQVLAVECSTRMTAFHIQTKYPATETDYEALSGPLHSCNTNLIFLEVILEFEARFGDFCKQVHSTFAQLRREEGLEDFSQYQQNMYMQGVDYQIQANEFRRVQARSLQKRIQSQMSVLYSLISQKDSRVNLSVAEDSKKIAAATMNDSKAMKLIALLTLVFLPGTLVAVSIAISLKLHLLATDISLLGRQSSAQASLIFRAHPNTLKE